MKKCIYKQCWFWLMIISMLIVIVIVLMISLLNIEIPSIFSNGSFWAAIGSIGTFVTVSITIKHFKEQEKNNRLIRTSEKFPLFRKEYKDIESQKAHETGRDNEIDENIENYLDDLERFAVCVNEGIYDIELISKMSGSALIDQYDTTFKEDIEKIKKKYSEDYNSNTIYEGIDKMVGKLREIKNQ